MKYSSCVSIVMGAQTQWMVWWTQTMSEVLGHTDFMEVWPSWRKWVTGVYLETVSCPDFSSLLHAASCPLWCELFCANSHRLDWNLEYSLPEMASVGYVLIVTIKLAATGAVVAVVRQESGTGLVSSLLSWPPLLGAFFPFTLYLITHEAPGPSELCFCFCFF